MHTELDVAKPEWSNLPTGAGFSPRHAPPGSPTGRARWTQRRPLELRAFSAAKNNAKKSAEFSDAQTLSSE